MTPRKSKRKQQSSRDKTRYNHKLGEQLADPLKEYRIFLDRLRETGIAAKSDFISIPPNLVDLTVTLILGLLARVNVNNVSTDTRMLQRIIVRTQISTTTFVLALFYATKVSRRHEKSLADVLIPALIVADKFLYDGTYTTKDWVEFTNHKYSVAELNSLERGFLNTLGYNLFITEKDYDRFLAYLDLMLWYRQIRMIGLLRWKSLSYCDIGKLDLRSCLGIGSLMGPLEVVSLMAKIVLNLFSWYISVLLFCGLTIYGLTVFKPAIAPANDLN